MEKNVKKWHGTLYYCHICIFKFIHNLDPGYIVSGPNVKICCYGKIFQNLSCQSQSYYMCYGICKEDVVSS